MVNGTILGRAERHVPVTALLVLLGLFSTSCAGSLSDLQQAGADDLSVVADGTEQSLNGDLDTSDSEAPGVGAGPAMRPGSPSSDPSESGDVGGLATSDGQDDDSRTVTTDPDPSTTTTNNDTGDDQPAAPGDEQTAAEVGVTDTTVVLGLFYPETGAYAAFGRNGPNVAQAAFNEVNARGGVHGRELVLKTYDDGTGDVATIRANEQRARDESFAFVSQVSGTNEVLAGFAEEDKVPVIVGNLSRELGQSLRYSFPVFPYWAVQAEILPSFIHNHLKMSDASIAVVYEGTSTSRNAKDAFVAAASSSGLSVDFEQPIEVNQATCVNEASNLQRRQITLVFIMSGPLGATCMLRDARALGYDPTWTGVGASWGLNVTSSAAGGAAEGIEMLGSVVTLETEPGRRFAETIRKHYPDSGADEDDAMLLFYSLLQFYIEALEQTGPDLTREAFVHALETKMSGVTTGYTPPPTFGPGDRTGPTAVSVTKCCQDGKWFTSVPGWVAEFR